MSDVIPFPDSVVPRGEGDPWVVLEDPDQVALYRQEWDYPSPSRVVCWADLPAKGSKIQRLLVYFHAMTHSGFRKAERLEHDLRGLERLRWLDVPLSFVPRLDPAVLPPSLRCLEVSGDGRASFAKGRVFPAVQVLDAWATLSTPNTEVRFWPETFPALQEVACRLDAKGALLDVLAAWPRLAKLRIGPMKDPATLRKLAPVAIDYLTLERGLLPSVDGIQAIRGLRYLFIRNIRGLVDIDALAACEELEVVAIQHCPNLRDHTALLKIPRLKSIWLHGCKALDPNACAADFASRPDLGSLISACNGSRR